MKKQLVIIGIITIFSTGLSGCDQFNVGRKNISVSIGEPSIEGIGDYVSIPLTITGDKSNYLLVMSNQEGTTVGINAILETNMADGIEPSTISIGQTYYQTGTLKTFTLIIFDDPDLDGSGNEVYRTTLSYIGANISIVNCSEPLWFYYESKGKYFFDDVYITIENHGDLPAPIDSCYHIFIDEIEYFVCMTPYDAILPDGSVEYLANYDVSGSSFSKLLTEGEHLMMFNITYNGITMATFSKTVEIS